VANTAANRRVTFGVHGRAGLLRHHVQGAIVFLITLALTTAALKLLNAAVSDPSRLLEATTLVTASACATVTRFIGLRYWVFSVSPNGDEAASGSGIRRDVEYTGASREPDQQQHSRPSPAPTDAR
jgi:hypothetical protein